MARITVEDCIDKFPSRFELVLVASQRAKKLHSGDAPTVEKNNDKHTVIALREIADSTITVDQMKENLIQEHQTITINDEEDENIKLDINESDEIQENLSEVIKDEVNTMTTSQEVEKEMGDLISSQESEIEEQYEISDNLDKNSNLEDGNNNEDLNLENNDNKDESAT
jgi:DNA-directed RNA polymerase subunit omega